MEYRQRRLIALIILLAASLITLYLVFFSPSERTVVQPTATFAPDNSNAAVPTQPAGNPETDTQKTAQSGQSNQDLTPNSALSNSSAPSSGQQMAAAPEWMTRIEPVPEHAVCPGAATRAVAVASGAELSAALASAEPGDQITLADGLYSGTFSIGAAGSSTRPIWICGSPSAIIDGGSWEQGAALSITGDYVGVWGITVSNALQGILVDGAKFTQLDNIRVHTTGDAGIRFQGGASDGWVQDSAIHHTGLRANDAGAGIEIGSANPDQAGTPGAIADKSARIRATRNQIWDTAAESIKVQPGASDGIIEFNTFDGTGMSVAGAWIDLRGTGFVVRGNTGVAAPKDGYQTHTVEGIESGNNNQFIGNTAQVNATGFGFSIQNPETTNNTVSCSNFVTNADAGFANIPCVS